MRYLIDKETGATISKPDCVDEVLFDIWAMGVDYDGRDTVEELKSLIDELVEMSKNARRLLWQNKLFGVYGSPCCVPSKE